MGTLTGQQINNTYDGLLKLADSTTGITTNLQAIEDGLGNNTGLRIATNQLEGDGLYTFVPLKGAYYGSGYVATNAAQFGAGTQNVIIASPFYDNGNYSYSAISFYTTTATSTSDTFEAALYTSQIINPFGLYPHTPIVSGITASTTSIGQKTYTFPTDISFSGYGAGIYWLVYKISNGGVQPTWRGGQGFIAQNIVASSIYGNTQQITANTFQVSPIRGNNLANSFQVFTGTTTFNNPFSSTLNTTQSSSATITGNMPGFILHTSG